MADLMRYWKDHPPVHVLVGKFVGSKPVSRETPPALMSRPGRAELEGVAAMLNGGGA